MFPLYDQSKVPGKKPWATLFLVSLNTLIFFISLPNLESSILEYGLIPSSFLQGKGLSGLFSAMFFHASFWHLFGNMWFLLVFGGNLERRMGKIKFLVFYLLCGAFSGLVYLVLASQKTIPAVGASGAISGILGAYLVLFPRNKIVSLVPIFFFIELIAVPVIIFVGIWFLYQLLYIGAPTNVAYWAHIAGFLGGMFFIRLFVKKKNILSYTHGH